MEGAEVSNTLSREARETRAAYKKEWTRRNPEKNKEYIARYWERRAKQQNGGDGSATKNAND